MPRRKVRKTRTTTIKRKPRVAARKRVTRITRAATPTPIASRNPFRWGESYTSLLLGIIVVIIGVLFVGSLIKARQLQHIQSISATSTIATVTPSQQAIKPSSKQQTYIVQTNDDLWHISEKFYKSGYYYTVIAKANNLANPSFIYKGDKLIIPSITPTGSPLAQVMVTPTPTQTQQAPMTDAAITSKTYTVVAGDDLWHIAVRAYGDGYRWVEIAKANNLANPDQIYSGNVLQLPR